MYGHLFHGALLYCASQIFWRFYKLKIVTTLHQTSLWVSFSSSICSFCVSVTHFGNSSDTSNPTRAKRFWLLKPQWWLVFFSKKYFLIKVLSLFFWHNVIAHLIDHIIKVTFICIRNARNPYNSLYCDICFIVMV